MRIPASLFLWSLVVCSLCQSLSAGSPPIKTLIIDGQNNHDWRNTTPLIRATLEECGRFTVDVATTPANPDEMSSFAPQFEKYGVIVSNYNGSEWSEATMRKFSDFVKQGGGFVSVHAADNSFPQWDDYNRMIGVGGWGGRNEKSGPYVRWRDGRFQRDTNAGPGGSHGRRHAFEVIVRDAQHPITAGLPTSWLQAEDELYAQLRGPADNMQVLATAFSSQESGGTGEHEPILMAIQFGQGRVFHTTLGHDVTAMNGLAFQLTLQRGAEWAATGQVTLPPITAEELSKEQVSKRDPLKLAQIDFQAIPDSSSGNDWQTLFNGQDFNGWTQRNGTAKYSVEEKCVVGRTQDGSPNSFMCTEQNYSDFELTFEVKVDDALNSGVQIRSRSLSSYKDGRVHGPQVEIESGGTAGYVYSEGTDRGWISPAQPKTTAFKSGQWNKYAIRAAGARIQTWVNGQKVEDLVDPASFRSGFIGLQVHGIPQGQGPYEVRWREIKLKKL